MSPSTSNAATPITRTRLVGSPLRDFRRSLTTILGTDG
jgi:hypothetical protein